MKKNFVRFFFWTLIFFAGCGWRTPVRMKKYHDAKVTIGTYVNIDVCAPAWSGPEVAGAMESVWQRFDEIDERMNAYHPESDVGRINASQGRAVTVHDDVYRLVQDAVVFAEETGGVFDITVKPLIDRWRRAKTDGRVPLPEEIDVARRLVGSDNIRFLGNDRLLCDNCAIDLGGIAKGFAVDEAARIFREHQFEHFLIDAGGDMYAAGKNCRGQSWRIGVRDPHNREQLIDILEISDQAVTTSGDYEQFYEIEGKRFSHIIDPRIGYPQEGAISATIMAPTAVEADVLSTSLMIWGPQGMDFIDGKGEGYAAFLITDHEGGTAYDYSKIYDKTKGRSAISSHNNAVQLVNKIIGR